MRIAAIDLGSNSFHLLVADAHRDGTFEPVVKDKEILRLGTKVAADGTVGDRSDQVVETVRRFKALAESLGTEEIVACATAALREARDSLAVVDRIETETGIKVRVISGREESRLIFDAVRSSVVLEPSPALAMDLGGGSLEMMVGDSAGLAWCASLKLGVARLTARLVHSDPPTRSDRKRLEQEVVSLLEPHLEVIRKLGPRMAVGSSGTLETLVRLAAFRRNGQIPASVNQLTVGLDELELLRDDLLTRSCTERETMPGVEAWRADLLPVGILVATTVIELSGLDSLTGCEWALREGMVLDAIGRHSSADWDPDPRSIRRESVLSLCRRCGYNQAHAEKVARIALELFDGMRPFHRLDDADRELLELGALLHDIGEHVSMDGHERHTAYLIENGRLRGFDPEEIGMLSCLGRFHKRGSPKRSFPAFRRLGAGRRNSVEKLVALLQVADGLDRSHGGPVRDVEVAASPGLVEVLVDAADDDIDLEVWGLRRKADHFQRMFSCQLEVAEVRRIPKTDPPVMGRLERACPGSSD